MKSKFFITKVYERERNLEICTFKVISLAIIIFVVFIGLVIFM